jgi:hypothetical protein
MQYNNNPIISEQSFNLSDCNTIKSIQKNNIIWDGITYGYGEFQPCKGTNFNIKS